VAHGLQLRDHRFDSARLYKKHTVTDSAREVPGELLPRKYLLGQNRVLGAN
jgi:hypothetical protein